MAKKILLIEDDEFISFIFKRQLEQAGFLVDTSLRGKEGLDAGLQGGYELVLLDIMLPDINGLDILRQLKLNAVAKSIPVIMLTNVGQESVIKEAYKSGAEGYLIKASYTPDQIVTEVQKFFTQQSQPAPQK